MEKVIGFFEKTLRERLDPKGMKRARGKDEITATQLRLDVSRENLDRALKNKRGK